MDALDVHREGLGVLRLELGVFLLELGQYTGHLKTAVPDGGKHFIHRVAAVAPGQRLHELVIFLIGDGHQIAAQLMLKRGAAFLDVFLPAFLFEPVADLVFGLAGLDNVQPVPAGAAVFRAGDDLDDLAGDHLMVDGHDAVVHLGPHHAVAHRGMDGIGKINDRCTRGQVDDIAPGREGKDLLGEQVALDIAEQVGGVGAGALAFQQLAHPGQTGVQLVITADDARLVFPVGGDAVFRIAVHVPGADLHLKGDGLPPDDGGVQALVAVGLGGGDVVLEPVGQRMVHVMDEAQRGVAFRDVVEDDAHGVDVVNFLKILLLHEHFAVDAVNALDPVADGGFLNAIFRQMGRDGVAYAVQEFIAVLIEQVFDVLIAHRVQIVQAAVLQLLLDGGHAQTVRDGRVDLHGLLGLVPALLFRPRIAGAHIVQTVAQFNDHDPHILAHGQQHFAQVFRLTVLHIGEVDLGQLGDAVHQQSHLAAEPAADLLDAHRGILRHIMHEGGGNALAVHTQLHEDLRHRQGMADIRLAAAAALVAVGDLRQLIGLTDHVQIIGPAAFLQFLFQRVIGNGPLFRFHILSLPFWKLCHSPASSCSRRSTGALARSCFWGFSTGCHRPDCCRISPSCSSAVRLASVLPVLAVPCAASSGCRSPAATPPPRMRRYSVTVSVRAGRKSAACSFVSGAPVQNASNSAA